MISRLFGTFGVLGTLSGALGLLLDCSWVILVCSGALGLQLHGFWGALGLFLGRLELLLATLGSLLGCEHRSSNDMFSKSNMFTKSP